MTEASPCCADGPLLRHKFRGTTEAVRSHLRAVEALGCPDATKSDRLEDVLIVLAEVLNNIVEHALAGIDDGWIECRLSRRNGSVSIETWDNGTPLPPALLHMGSAPEVTTDVADLPEGGFGWFIVHSLTDDMMYERTNGHNRLSFSLQIS